MSGRAPSTQVSPCVKEWGVGEVKEVCEKMWDEDVYSQKRTL